MDISIIIEKDGNQWCAHREDFVNLQESIAGFGYTETQALAELLEEERKDEIPISYDNKLTSKDWDGILARQAKALRRFI